MGRYRGRIAWRQRAVLTPQDTCPGPGPAGDAPSRLMRRAGTSPRATTARGRSGDMSTNVESPRRPKCICAPPPTGSNVPVAPPWSSGRTGPFVPVPPCSDRRPRARAPEAGDLGPVEEPLGVARSPRTWDRRDRPGDFSPVACPRSGPPRRRSRLVKREKSLFYAAFCNCGGPLWTFSADRCAGAVRHLHRIDRIHQGRQTPRAGGNHSDALGRIA
jgi:hypothetical protein